MSNVIPFRMPPKVVLELLGRDYSGEVVFATRYVDEDGISINDYIGTSYIDAMRSAAAWIEDGCRLVDRIAGTAGDASQ